MNLATLIALQFIAHLLTDYFLQSEQQAIEKNKQGFRSKFLLKHFVAAFL